MSYHLHEPILHATPVLDLRPTQMTRRHARGRAQAQVLEASTSRKSSTKFLGQHMVPVVSAPAEQRYLIDHHHLARALHDEGVDSVFVTIVADLHKLDAHASGT